MELSGNYNLRVIIGDSDVPISPQAISELTITEDIDRFVPTFKMTLRDDTRLLADVVPFDQNASTVTIEFTRSIRDASTLNSMTFSVKRRNAESPSGLFSVEGVLDVPVLLTHRKSRVLTGNLRTSLENLSKNDFGISSTDVGASLSYDKTIVQPNWTDAKLLRYLKANLEGKNQESAYECFIPVVEGAPVFVFKSLNEFLTSEIKYNLIVGHREYKDFIPVNEYKIYDNSGLFADLHSRNQYFGYFNYETGVWTEESISIEDCPALPEFYLIDTDKDSDVKLTIRTGRSNAFTSNFRSRIRNDFYLRTSNLIHMWASTWGLQNASPGNIVQVVFADALERGQLFLYQHSGLWMIKRVVHIFGSSFMTNLLLTRCGIDTDISNTLTETGIQRKRR